ncbi:BTAD domain-containing putative transcriptional regulator [Pseudonocardia broussonetiae]|uniref:AfsR/SARP family transcriptional regulator n=1 Tax=Pseudonocardia broussonetiae TaxID=2736640 RepID=A0A6M6JM22_9PSEU|nr:BTAD domain-containing putative transcriptional regulator [Pseudonocardia broussonetiae]QJY49008.1 AfsR/SARP family transcriptional regulator [Pseudonocardia broussonetiae]
MLTVAVLGRVEAHHDGVPATIPGGLTTELLVRLALDAGRPVRAERLVEDLWPDATGVRLNTLQAKISQLRRALGAPASLTSGPVGYTLDVAPGDVDALEALRLAEAGATQLDAGDPAGALHTCRTGLALFGPDVLPGAGAAAWVLPHRARLEEARAGLVEDELAARLALGAAGEVIGELESCVAASPLRERLWSLLITALYRAGRQADALAAYRRVTALLADQLGVDPGPGLRGLEQQVLTHDRALAPEIAAGRRGNLPALTSPLIGRATELAALLANLATHRLVTLVGPAGVGKTRLATEVARRSLAPDGAWLVRLEGVGHAAELPSALVDALPGTDGIAGLRGAEVLVVLDNCEHLVEPVAELVTTVLGTAPAVRVLATSQRALGLDGEVVDVIGPLPEADAVALFAHRATQRRPSFTLTAETEPDVAQLCRALECLPIAIELAAARARILTVPDIARRLDDRFTLLADPTSGGPHRRRTLAAALRWSYDLLFPDDQRGLWALAQFPAGATMAGVEHVLAALGVPVGSALDVVERLVDWSLATIDPVDFVGAADPDRTGAIRYRLLDSVRAFAVDRAAEAAAADVAADALLSWVAGLADVVDAHVRGPGQAARVAATAAERATIDAALDRSRLHDPATGLRIAVGFGWAWVLLDDAAAAARLRAARTAAPEAPPDLRVSALLLESWLEAMSGDLAQARAALDAATALIGPDTLLADLTRWHGAFVLLQEGRPADALADLECSRTAFSSRGCTWHEGASLLLAAFAHLALGDTTAGRTACEGAIRLIAPLDDTWGLLHAEGLLGGIARAEHRFADAARHHAHAAESAAALGFGGATALHLANLGRSQHDAGDPAAAGTLQRALTAAEQEGDLRLLAETRVSPAEVLLFTGDRAAAQDLLLAADRWYTASGGGDGAALAARLLATLRAESPVVEPPVGNG